MTNRIVIVDETPTQRIVLSAALRQGGLDAISFASIPEAIGILQQVPDSLVVASHALLQTGEIAQLNSAGHRHWTIGIVPSDSPDLRMDALQAGAEAVMASPINPDLLCAKIRRIQRHRNAETDLLPSWDNARALGFAEQGGATPYPGNIVICSPDHGLPHKLAKLTRARTAPLATVTTSDTPHAADVAIFDQRDATNETELLRKMADLRAHAQTRQIMQMVLFTPQQAEIAPVVLDMGADDVLIGTYSDAEIAHRATRLVRRKHASETFRNRVRDGLRAAVTDPLTGLANRRFAIPKLVELSNDVLPIAICVVDLDHFKQVNDAHGHAVGDEVLAAVADRLRNGAGPNALVARLGGEEFLVAAAATTVQDAEKLAQQLGALIKARPVAVRSGRQEVAVTASIGVSFCDTPLLSDTQADEFIHHADQALYASKHAGRDCVTMAQSAA